MSEWEKQPSFENNFKDLIEDLFAAPKKVEEAVQEVKPKPTKKLVIPDPPKQTKTDEETALKYAKEEMEHLRKAFLDFTNQVNDSVMYSFMYPHVEEFVEKCKQMQTLLEDDIDQDKLTQHGLKDYEDIVKIRGTILSVILEKYNRE